MATKHSNTFRSLFSQITYPVIACKLLIYSTIHISAALSLPRNSSSTRSNQNNAPIPDEVCVRFLFQPLLPTPRNCEWRHSIIQKFKSYRGKPLNIPEVCTTTIHVGSGTLILFRDTTINTNVKPVLLPFPTASRISITNQRLICVA